MLTLGEKGLIYSQKSDRDGKWGDVQYIKAETVNAVDTTVSASVTDSCVHCLATTL